jgi:PhnB protein
MVSIQPELWVDRAASAVEFYRSAFGARVVMSVGDGDDIVAQLMIDDAGFWVAGASTAAHRFSPPSINGATGRILLAVEDPDAVFDRSIAAGATATSPVADEHGWRVGQIIDPFGHEWEITRPPADWPPG